MISQIFAMKHCFFFSLYNINRIDFPCYARVNVHQKKLEQIVRLIELL